MAILGYARVSTQDQHLTGQLEALTAAGATTIYREKISGARADRPQLAKLMASLKPGDIVQVTKLDRLGRSTRELLDLIERIGKAGASFRSLGDPLWDTSSSQGRLQGIGLCDLQAPKSRSDRADQGRRREPGQRCAQVRLPPRCYPPTYEKSRAGRSAGRIPGCGDRRTEGHGCPGG